MVLVGNKCDLEEQRQVSKGRGELLAQKLGKCEFFECSAKTSVNIDRVFYTVLQNIHLQTVGTESSRKKYKKCAVL